MTKQQNRRSFGTTYTTLDLGGFRAAIVGGGRRVVEATNLPVRFTQNGF